MNTFLFIIEFEMIRTKAKFIYVNVQIWTWDSHFCTHVSLITVLFKNK